MLFAELLFLVRQLRELLREIQFVENDKNGVDQVGLEICFVHPVHLPSCIRAFCSNTVVGPNYFFQISPYPRATREASILIFAQANVHQLRE